MNKNTLDVVTVCFNDLAGLKETAQSLLSQTEKGFQWIVVDGGSKDGTLDFLHSMQDKISLRFVSEKDRGVYDAMNKGIGMGTSDFIWFLNAGDFCYDKNSVQNIRQSLSPEMLNIYQVSHPKKGEMATTVSHLKGRQKFFNMPVCHQGILYKRDAFRSVGDFDLNLKLAADYEHLRRVLHEGHGFSSHEQIICQYKGGGLSEKRLALLYREILRVSLKYNPLPLKIFSIPLYGYRYLRYVLLKPSPK